MPCVSKHPSLIKLIELCGDKLTLFGQRAFKKNGVYYKNIGTDGSFEEIPPPKCEMSALIGGCIDDALEKGVNPERVHSVAVNAYTAICLYFEGRIKKEHIDQAVCRRHGFESITLMGVEFKTRSNKLFCLDVIIFRQDSLAPEPTLVDANGQLILHNEY